MGEKGSHPAGAHPRIEAAKTTFPRACSFAAGPWVEQRREWGGGRDGWDLSFSWGEPYPSSINTCALIVGLAAECTIIPISQSDRLRLGGEALVSGPRLP